MDSLPFSMNGSLQTQGWDDMPCLHHSLLTSQLGFLSCSQRREQAWRAGFNAGFDDGYRKGTDARTQVSGDDFTGVSEIQPVGLGHYSNIEPEDIADWPILETTQHIPPDLAMSIPAESTAGSFGMSNFGFGGNMSFSDSQKPSLALDAEPISQNSPATSINLIPHRSPPYASDSSNGEVLYLADKAASYNLPADEKNTAHPDQNYLLTFIAQSEERASKFPSPPLGAQIMEEPISSSVDINTTETITTTTNNLELADCAPRIYPAPDSAPIYSSVDETLAASPSSNSRSINPLCSPSTGYTTGSPATTDGFASFTDSAIGSGSTDASSAATSISSGSPGGCLTFAAFPLRSGLSGASSATTPVLYDSPGASLASLSTPSPSGLWLEPIIQAESPCLDVVESCREEDDGIALPDGMEPPDSPNSPTAMCTLNDISRNMMLSGQLENDASNDSPAYNNPNDEYDAGESPPELHLACDTALKKLPIIDVNGDGSWTEVESEESKNEKVGDLEKPQGRKRRSQQPLNDRPKRARQVTPGTNPEATSEKWYFNLKSISLQNQKGRKKQEIHWSTRGRCWLDQATRKEIEGNSLLEECCILSIEIQIRLDWPLMILTKQKGGWEGSNAQGDCRLQVNTRDVEDAIRHR
ncbi:hypothetical protein B0J13DRAFT_612927 [Dactylonectria estremocensis]|uniref:Uncharacterized protein n=1 Tax=Dactylonectria estremocensis TaxID=1079267 RepID=A0A9P9DF47_9HYPO|nr:hypothetical protein B0J13DRAFT_612927 [Dactylonectria estremocensis]